ncbi:unnamed protein product [Moneuplotes crassus]|uniref:Uncharacterized protein n=1 Tax=Euplotes crassus TaxID=5936 RepID=A0AAD1U885_EUPCR|nr:unnamed protein product [Moneuplotes crassus]
MDSEEDNEIELQQKLAPSLDSEDSLDLDSKIDQLKSEKDQITYLDAFKNLAIASFTCAGGLLLRRSMEIFNYMILGRLGDPALVSGAGLGNSTINITLLSIGIGFTGAIETLSSQAFGKGDNYLAGCYYTRAQVILTIILLPICIMFWYLTPILIYIGQEVQTSIYAGNFVRAWIPGTFSFCQSECLRKFLIAQGQYSLMPKIQIGTSLLHPLWLYINVYILDLSIEGVAYSTRLF